MVLSRAPLSKRYVKFSLQRHTEQLPVNKRERRCFLYFLEDCEDYTTSTRGVDPHWGGYT